MGQVVGAMACSHAYTFLDPTQWEQRRQISYGNYRRRFGTDAAPNERIALESLEHNLRRYGRIRDALANARDRLHASQPDAVILIGDDQDENYLENTLPQLAIYVGEGFTAVDRHAHQPGARYTCDTELAHRILNESVQRGFDLAYSRSFADDALLSHAHREPLAMVDPQARLPIVPIFVNAIHVPAPTPARCYEFGRALREIIDSAPADKRVAVCASGGLSHFSAGYPWTRYRGPYALGGISEEFDRHLLDSIEHGEGRELASLSSDDLLSNGEIELRQWIILLGIVGAQRPAELVYEPFYSGMMGMGVGYWALNGAAG